MCVQACAHSPVQVCSWMSLIMGSRCSLTDPVQGETEVHAGVKVTLGKCRHTLRMRAFLIGLLHVRPDVSCGLEASGVK